MLGREGNVLEGEGKPGGDGDSSSDGNPVDSKRVETGDPVKTI